MVFLAWSGPRVTTTQTGYSRYAIYRVKEALEMFRLKISNLSTIQSHHRHRAATYFDGIRSIDLQAVCLLVGWIYNMRTKHHPRSPKALSNCHPRVVASREELASYAKRSRAEVWSCRIVCRQTRLRRARFSGCDLLTEVLSYCSGLSCPTIVHSHPPRRSYSIQYSG